MNDALKFTGERFLPECQGEMWHEHWHRYHLVRTAAQHRRVLDVACGEGYGTALLAGQGNQVWGVDLSPAAVAHARQTYSGQEGLGYAVADCRKLPFADASFDLVVSFETLEHIAGQRAFLAEVRRVLDPRGALIISSPNKLEYSDRRNHQNEFHVGELYRDELATMLQEYFPHARWYGQRNAFVSLIWDEQPSEQTNRATQWLNVARQSPRTDAGLPEPMYFLCTLASTTESATLSLPGLSLLGDREEFIYRDYEQAVRDVRRIEPAREALAAQLWTAEHMLKEVRALLAEREQNASDLKSETRRLAQQLMERDTEVADYRAGLAVEREQAGIEVEALRAQIANLTKQSFDLHAAATRDSSRVREMDSRLKERDQSLVRQAELLTKRAHEINRRASLLWWLKLPWLRLLGRVPPV